MRPGECKRVRASAVAAARATPPRFHRHRKRRRRHNLILSVPRVARRHHCPSGVRPLNGFINTHIIHDVLFIRIWYICICICICMYVYCIGTCTRPSPSCLRRLLLRLRSLYKIDDWGPSTTHPYANIPCFIFSRVVPAIVQFIDST